MSFNEARSSVLRLEHYYKGMRRLLESYKSSTQEGQVREAGVYKEGAVSRDQEKKAVKKGF